MDYSVLGLLLPRYFRVVGDASRDGFQHKIEGVISKIIPWQPTYCSVPGCLSIQNSNYKERGLYPMDIASSIPIILLRLPADRQIKVLDVCCCPGSKFQMISDQSTSDSLVVGVDISKQRLEVCMSLLRSWHKIYGEYSSKRKCRRLVFHGDGTNFGRNRIGNMLFDSEIIDKDVEISGQIKKRNKSYRDRENKRLKALEASIIESGKDGSEEPTITMYDFDYVLVDAECTHDASYKHMKFIPPTEGTKGATIPESGTMSKPTAQLAHKRLTGENTATSDPSTTGAEQLRDLQRALLKNGFANLKVGGELVYSTCSQERAQNEDIVQWLLDQQGSSAQLVNAVDTLREVLPNGVSLKSAHEENVVSNIRDNDSTAVARTATTISSPTDIAPATTPPVLLSAEEVLQLSLPELANYLHTHCATEAAVRELSFAIWEWAASQDRPVVFESAVLPGTVRLSYQGAMSGHFVAKIRKMA